MKRTRDQCGSISTTPTIWKQTSLTDVFHKMKKGLPLSQKKVSTEQTFVYQSPICIKIEDDEDDVPYESMEVPKRTLPFPFSDDESENTKPPVPVETMRLNKPVPYKKLKYEELDVTVASQSLNSINISLNTSTIKTESNLEESQIRSLNLFKDILLNATNSLQSQKLLGDNTNLFQTFLDMNEQYQFFVFKLFTHKLKWYAINSFCASIKLKMDYEEITTMHQYLLSAGFLDTNFLEESTLDKLKLLGCSQIKKIYNSYKLPRNNKNKTRMVDTLMKNCKTQSTLLSSKSFEEKLNDDINRTIGNTVKLKEDVLNSFRNSFILVTFANSDFIDWQNYALQMLKTRIIFPHFQVQDFIIFSSQEEFETYAQARKLQIDLENTDMKEKGKLERIGDEAFENLQLSFKKSAVVDRFPNAPYLNKFTDKWVYCSIISTVARNLFARYCDKVKSWLEYIIEHFPKSHRIGRWYDLLCWLHIKYLKPTDYALASKILVTALLEKCEQLSEVQFYELANRAEKLLKHLPESAVEELNGVLPPSLKSLDLPSYKIDVNALKKDEVGGARRVYVLQRNGESTYASVEEAALRRYIEVRNYTDGRHCEGAIIITLFKLFFWDVIYDNVVPLAFISQVQDVPLDMYSKCFYTNRKSKIDERLKDIEVNWSNKELIEFITNIWEKNCHVSCLRETASIISSDFVLIIECIGRRLLSKIFQRLVNDLSAYKSGLPDLLIWNKDTKNCIFVEVKGEGDTLSIGQTLWIKYLLENEAKVEVCHVRSIGIRRNVKMEDI